jgi:hypothetical protein
MAKNSGLTDSTGFALGKENLKLMLIGLVIIILGFALMTGGKTTDPNVFDKDVIFSFRRITLAPVVVVFGFLFEIYAIMKKPKSKN